MNALNNFHSELLYFLDHCSNNPKTCYSKFCKNHYWLCLPCFSRCLKFTPLNKKVGRMFPPIPALQQSMMPTNIYYILTELMLHSVICAQCETSLIQSPPQSRSRNKCFLTQLDLSPLQIMQSLQLKTTLRQDCRKYVPITPSILGQPMKVLKVTNSPWIRPIDITEEDLLSFSTPPHNNTN